MAAVIQELLRYFDMLSIEARVDIQQGIKKLYSTGQIQKGDVYLLKQFAIGYSIKELSLSFPAVPVDERVNSALSLLAEETGNTDERYLQGILRAYPKFRNRADAYRKKLNTYTIDENEKGVQ